MVMIRMISQRKKNWTSSWSATTTTTKTVALLFIGVVAAITLFVHQQQPKGESHTGKIMSVMESTATTKTKTKTTTHATGDDDNSQLARAPVVPELIYELVLSEGDKQHNNRILRYAAKEKSKQKDGTYQYQNVTVQRWLSLLTTTTTTTTASASNNNNSSKYYYLIEQFNDILFKTDMKAYFFETKGVSYVTSQTIPFEFVLVENSYLYDFADAKQDPTDFGEKLLECGNSSDDGVVGCVFPNLGGDSILIAPFQQQKQTNNIYGHLAAFIRRAPTQQVLLFWKLALETFQQTLLLQKEKTYWFSTDGRGVKWLHIRIDPRPKYYDYQPFAVTDNNDP